MIGQRLEIRQGQGLVITPQLQQAIKLLQLSNLELDDFVEAELDRNPLLQREEPEGETPEPARDQSFNPTWASPTPTSSIRSEVRSPGLASP